MDDSGQRYLNRELSWLDFNERVLDLARDDGVPLLERVKFCGIVSSNLDEFFMVRVAGLHRQVGTGVDVRFVDGRTAPEVLAEVTRRVNAAVAEQSRVWNDELEPGLAHEGICITAVSACGDADRRELERHFDSNVYPVLTPLAVGPGQPFPYISGLSLSLGVFVRDPATQEERFARVKVPEGMPRFTELPTSGVHVPLEDEIAHFLPRLFPGMDVLESAVFRVTRDADLEVSDEADDLLEAVETELRRRRFGEVVRVEVAARMSRAMVDRLCEAMDVGDDEVYTIDGLLDLADVSQLASLPRPDLRFDPWSAAVPARLADTEDGPADMFAEIRRGDLLVHFPYEAFSSTVEAFVGRSAADPDVVALKTTVYRTSDESPLVPALVRAAEDGKQSVCLVELKARFDERRNIEWSRALERAGCHVAYGFPHLKIHAKTTLIVRREGGVLRRYAHIGTGNYHAVTARLYEDFGIFTDDEDITADIADLFNHVTGFGRPSPFRKLLVAPFSLRDRLLEEIRAVSEAHDDGSPGRIFIKANALTDVAIIDALYDASQRGVRVDIVARSICSLRPGVSGLSETVRVTSIVGRFLEHSRLFMFEAGRHRSCFFGSADLMPRNLDHRIEVVVPIEDPALRKQLAGIRDIWLADEASAWELRADGSWHRLRPPGQAWTGGSQETLMARVRGAPAAPEAAGEPETTEEAREVAPA